MCISEGLVIGICGGTCVGKTTVADGIARALRWDRRDCGMQVVEAAGERGGAVRELGLETHREIDRETLVCAADGRRGVVIDGRYLRYVLVELTAVTVVELTCSRAVRGVRYQRRNGVADADPGWLVDESDREDGELCSKLYGIAPRRPDQTLDTTELTGAAVAARICAGLGLGLGLREEAFAM